MCPKMEATTIYYYSQVPKTIDFDSCTEQIGFLCEFFWF